MFTLASESALRATFRPKDAKLFGPLPNQTYPAFVRDYLAWVHPAGGRVFLVFAVPQGTPTGIVFDTNGGLGPSAPAMCDWCHCSSVGTGVGLLSARLNAKKRVGVHVCADLSCKQKLEDEANRSGHSVVPAMARLLDRMGRFAHEALQIDYIGGVCDASTSSKTNLRASVYELDGTTFTEIFDFPLTYPKGYPAAINTSITGWFPWTDTFSDLLEGTVLRHPVPMFTDIEFHVHGSMVLAFGDRTGLQGGDANYRPNNSSTTLYETNSQAGDILRAFYANGTFVLENNAKAGPNVGYAANNSQGPGFGEFYNDNWIQDGNPNRIWHAEQIMGGLALKPGSGEVVVTTIDPVDQQPYAGGVRYPGPTGEKNSLHLHGRGVFVCISPWNFPLAIFVGQIAAALASGNTVVAKPAEQTPLTAAAAVRMLHMAGFPGDVLHFLPGDGKVGAALVEDPRCSGVAFTGSTEVARIIARTLAGKDGPIGAIDPKPVARMP